MRTARSARGRTIGIAFGGGAAGRANARRARSSSRMDHMVSASGCAVQLYMPAVRRCEPERYLGGTRGRAPPQQNTEQSGITLACGRFTFQQRSLVGSASGAVPLPRAGARCRCRSLGSCYMNM